MENDINTLVRLDFDVLMLMLLQCYSRFGPGEIYYKGLTILHYLNILCWILLDINLNFKPNQYEIHPKSDVMSNVISDVMSNVKVLVGGPKLLLGIWEAIK